MAIIKYIAWILNEDISFQNCPDKAFSHEAISDMIVWSKIRIHKFSANLTHPLKLVLSSFRTWFRGIQLRYDLFIEWLDMWEYKSGRYSEKSI